MKIFTSYLIVATLVAICSLAYVWRDKPDAQAQFENTFSIFDKLENYKVPAVSIAVIHNYKLDWAKAYGWAQKETQRKVTENTVFQACSISKPVSALAILKLATEKNWDLDHNINDYLRDWQVPGNSFSEKEHVTIRKILNHTAGFQTGRRPMYPWGQSLPTTMQILQGIAPSLSQAVTLQFSPGSRYLYSGAGYTILQELLEESYPLPFAEIMTQKILAPLGMIYSSFLYPVPLEQQSRVAHGYNQEGNAMTYPWYDIADLMAGGLWTNPTDLARFILEIQNALRGQGIILTRDIAQQMLNTHQDHFGLGIRVFGDGKNIHFSHGGDNAGYKALIFGFAQSGMGAVIMTNSDNGWGLCIEVLQAIAKLYQWPIIPDAACF